MPIATPRPVATSQTVPAADLADDDMRAAVACLIVETLQLEQRPEEIDPDARLFGEGLGLDSIDALELALAISRRYGFELKSDDETNHQIFRSLRSLAAHVEKRRTR